jgi:hypothetical protein
VRILPSLTRNFSDVGGNLPGIRLPLMEVTAMRHRILLAATAIAMATAAWASSPHFIYANGSLSSIGDYVASWKEAGLANSPVTYSLTAGYTQAWYQCYTKSNNMPQGSPNSVSQSNATTQGTFPPSHNGQITAALTLEPTPPVAGCQGGGLKLCLTSVTYTDMVLKDETNGVYAPALPDQSGGPFLDTRGRPTNCQ